MGFMNKLAAKYEAKRLEHRYSRGRDQRTTFLNEAVYIDGEYIYPGEYPPQPKDAARPSPPSRATTASASPSQLATPLPSPTSHTNATSYIGPNDVNGTLAVPRPVARNSARQSYRSQLSSSSVDPSISSRTSRLDRAKNFTKRLSSVRMVENADGTVHVTRRSFFGPPTSFNYHIGWNEYDEE